MEWQAPALVLSAAPYGESALVVHVLAEAEGSYRGLVRGGVSRRQAGLWQPGNLVQARWFARLSEQLGTLSGELVFPTASRVLDHALPLGLLASACALADAALPEREPHPLIFAGLLRLLTSLGLDPAAAGRSGPAMLIRWEADLLAELGFGLDLSACALSGQTTGLSFVSPRTGRAVAEAASGAWRDRLLPLPRLLLDSADAGTAAEWAAGLRLTGHFLARDAFGQRHRPLPAARLRLLESIEREVDKEGQGAALDPLGPQAPGPRG